MLQVLSKIAVPLVLLLALTFLTGVASAASSVTEKEKVDLCCDHGQEESVPSAGEQCSDPACGCLSCSVSIHFQEFLIKPFLSWQDRSLWILVGSMPSGHPRSIEYPPENLHL